MESVTLTIADMVAYPTRVTCVGPNLYRLDEEANFFLFAGSDEEADALPRFGDTFRARVQEPGTLHYECLHERGAYRHYEFMLNGKLAESSELDALMVKWEERGAHWERHMVGMLFVSVPSNSDLDPASELQSLTAPRTT